MSPAISTLRTPSDVSEIFADDDAAEAEVVAIEQVPAPGVYNIQVLYFYLRKLCPVKLCIQIFMFVVNFSSDEKRTLNVGIKSPRP